MLRVYAYTSKVENSAQVLPCWLKFVLSESPTHLQPEEEVVAGHGVTLAKVLRHRQRHVLLKVHRRPLRKFQNFFSASSTPQRNKLNRPSLANVFGLCLMYLRKADTQGQDNDIQ